MTALQIIEYLKAHLITNDDYGEGELWHYRESVGLGTIAVVNSVGDKEGGGEYSEIVYNFVDYGVYLKITGFYSSYNGTDWNDDWTEVFPQEKMTTVYE